MLNTAKHNIVVQLPFEAMKATKKNLVKNPKSGGTPASDKIATISNIRK